MRFKASISLAEPFLNFFKISQGVSTRCMLHHGKQSICFLRGCAPDQSPPFSVPHQCNLRDTILSPLDIWFGASTCVFALLPNTHEPGFTSHVCSASLGNHVSHHADGMCLLPADRSQLSRTDFLCSGKPPPPKPLQHQGWCHRVPKVSVALQMSTCT